MHDFLVHAGNYTIYILMFLCIWALLLPIYWGICWLVGYMIKNNWDRGWRLVSPLCFGRVAILVQLIVTGALIHLGWVYVAHQQLMPSCGHF